jgi:hypothetical protein
MFCGTILYEFDCGECHHCGSTEIDFVSPGCLDLDDPYDYDDDDDYEDGFYDYDDDDDYNNDPFRYDDE